MTCQNFQKKCTIDQFVSVPFNLQDVKILPKNYYERFDLYMFYVTTNQETITKLQRYYIKFGGSNLFDSKERLSFSSTTNLYEPYCGGLTSVFDKEGDYDQLEDLDNIDEVNVCPICYRWFVAIENTTMPHFVKVNPLKILWYDYFHYDKDKFIYQTPEDYDYVLAAVSYI